MIYFFLADGFEEAEALCPIDILKRAGIEVKTVGITDKTVIGSHQIAVTADISAEEAEFSSLTGVVLPGGMPGTVNLEKSNTVQKFLDFAYENNLLIGAICAAPSVLGHKGFLKGKKATCFPGFETELIGAELSPQSVVSDGNIVTAKGAGAAFEFGFELLTAITKNPEISEKLKRDMQYPL